MGVSAIFVAAMASTRLPAPLSPPENQPQLLATTVTPIASLPCWVDRCARGTHSTLDFWPRDAGVHGECLSVAIVKHQTQLKGAKLVPPLLCTNRPRHYRTRQVRPVQSQSS